jgi:CheY-like chemotaxis protein
MKTALVADNDLLFVEFLSTMLEERGYRVFKAFDGLDALAQLKQIAMDVFFVDIYMPKLDGRSVIRRVRESRSHDQMKIIAISAARRQSVEGLDDLACYAFLQKAPLEEMSKELDLLMESLVLSEV